MHAVSAADRKDNVVERAMAQINRIEALVASLRVRTLEREAWIEFVERGRKLDT